jgi:lipoteichoic acid synthase
MWRAAGGALNDSIVVYVTPANLLWIAITIAAAFIPRYGESAFRRTFGDSPAEAGLPVLLLAALGPAALAHVDTRGLDRNAWSALITTASRSALATLNGPRHAFTPTLAAASLAQPDAALAHLRGAASGRNVIFVSLESTAAQYLALYGAPYDAMPNLSALARSAIVFDRAYAVYPESIRGLFSILCSRYPAFDRDAESNATAPCRSIARHFRDRGYRTALFHSGRFGYLGMESVIRDRGFDLLMDAGDIGGSHESSFGVDDRATVERILAWIDRVPRGDRFFVTYLPIAGHHPYASPEAGPFPVDDEFGRYRNALHYGDAALGDLIRGVAARGLDQQTLWIVLGDHGEAFGQHDGNFGHTFQLYEENVHVPFLIAAPGLISAPQRAAQIVSLLDTAPTLLDLAGLPADNDYEGTSVLMERRTSAIFFADYSLRLRGKREGDLKYIHDLDSGRVRVFDLARDPFERQSH